MFAIDDGWLVVCETSVRLIPGGVQTSRLELADVVLEARWREPNLTVLDASHELVELAIADGQLAAKVAG